MIPENITKLLKVEGYSQRTDAKAAIRATLDALKIDPKSELGLFCIKYIPSHMLSKEPREELLDFLEPTPDGKPLPDNEPSETPVAMETFFVRDCWEVPERLICLSTTEGEGAYLYDLESEAVYDFDLKDQSKLCDGTLLPRWNSFFEFLEWYLS